MQSIVASIAVRLGWDVALSFLAWVLRKGYVRFRVELGKDHPLWVKGARIIEDGKISKAEVIMFLQELDNHIPGKIDDIIVVLLVAALGQLDDFVWDQSDKVLLFAAIAKMIEDGVFTNQEAAVVLDTVNEVTGLLRS
ncbi:unnamed protein product [marine sediment metagenome]|uniref:Uncharacterized protein n=1 Tax=marine sediment metagenome TaxID=412755 RepID=X1IYT9_9ZZZZ